MTADSTRPAAGRPAEHGWGQAPALHLSASPQSFAIKGDVNKALPTPGRIAKRLRVTLVHGGI